MTVTNVHKDAEALAMTITAEFDAPVDKVWQMWENPRQLEQWWGPPTYPATFVDFDFTPGGTASYFMTGPEGDQPHGWWRITSIEAPHRLEYEDGFANEDGTPNSNMPTMNIAVEIVESGATTRMTVRTTFPSLDAMEQLVSMGMDEGMTAAFGQIDALLAAI